MSPLPKASRKERGGENTRFHFLCKRFLKNSHFFFNRLRTDFPPHSGHSKNKARDYRGTENGRKRFLKIFSESFRGLGRASCRPAESRQEIGVLHRPTQYPRGCPEPGRTPPPTSRPETETCAGRYWSLTHFSSLSSALVSSLKPMFESARSIAATSSFDSSCFPSRWSTNCR